MKPLKNAKRGEFPPLAVFDIEATEWVNVQIVCHVDEYGNRVSFTDIKSYLEWLMEHFEGDAVWSHFGSGYDNRFLVDEVARWEGSSYKAIMSGGLPIIFIVQNEAYTVPSKKNGHPRERQIRLLDSFRLLPTSLANIGKSIGQLKQEVDRSRIEKLTPEQVADYCFSDCDILLKGMQTFRDTIVAEGGIYSPTSASIASNFIRADPNIDWKRFFEPSSNYQRYSGESFELMLPHSEPGMIQADEFAESAYYGGRCEVFSRGHFDGPLYYYDIASAYPWAMRQKLPFYFLGFKPGASMDEPGELEKILKHHGVSDAYVTIPRGTFEIPPLPVRSDSGKVVFAEGRFHGRWANAELWALYKRGRDKGVRIDVSCWASYTGVAFAKPFVDRIYALRKQAKSAGDEGLSMIYKILLNSCYGKLAQQLEQSCFVFGDAWEFLRQTAEEDGRLRPCPLPGVSEIVEETAGPFRHVAAGAYVTALARLKLLEGMERAVRAGARLYYCDTDSIIIDKPIRGWGGSKDLGSWELEHTFASAEFLCPKVYRAVTDDGALVLKAKGTSLKSQLEPSEPKAAHDHERLMRWAVYARDISPWAAKLCAGLSEGEMRHYGRVQAGLLGWRSGVRLGNVEPQVSLLDRMARNEDTKRSHHSGMSDPLYLEGDGEGEAAYLDVRTLDAESLLELELAEHYDENTRLRIIASEPEIFT